MFSNKADSKKTVARAEAVPTWTGLETLEVRQLLSAGAGWTAPPAVGVAARSAGRAAIEVSPDGARNDQVLAQQHAAQQVQARAGGGEDSATSGRRSLTAQTRTSAADDPQIAWDPGVDSSSAEDVRRIAENGEPGGDVRVRERAGLDGKGMDFLGGPGIGIFDLGVKDAHAGRPDLGVKDGSGAETFDILGSAQTEAERRVASEVDGLREATGRKGVDDLDPTNHVFGRRGTFGFTSSDAHGKPDHRAGLPEDGASKSGRSCDSFGKISPPSGASGDPRLMDDAGDPAPPPPPPPPPPPADDPPDPPLVKIPDSRKRCRQRLNKKYNSQGNKRLKQAIRKACKILVPNRHRPHPDGRNGGGRELTEEEMAAVKKAAKNKLPINPTGPDDQPPPQSAMFKLSPQQLRQDGVQPYITPDPDGGSVLGGSTDGAEPPRMEDNTLIGPSGGGNLPHRDRP
jgi:hypothetical protein